MNKKKTKVKARRRAKKYQEQAWQAAASGNLDLARKGLRRALDQCSENPQIWNDYGLVLQQDGELEDAEKALRNAIVIAPDYAEAYANLASLVGRLGRTIQAERLQERAVGLAPGDAALREQLETFRALLPVEEPVAASAVEASVVEDADLAASADDRLLRLDRYDWSEIGRELEDNGCVQLEKLLTPRECDELVSLWGRDESFENTVHLTGETGDAGSYRFFRRPLPEIVQRLRTAVYARLAPIANRWNVLLGRGETWPKSHRAFLAQCADAGQTRTTPILLRYNAPAVNELHQDVWGRVYFPLQLAVTLSPRGLDVDGSFEGGSFIFADRGRGRKIRRLAIATGLGDAVIFCTRERLVRFDDRWACQPVFHGMAPLTRGERYVVGIPFHQYKGETTGA